MQIKNRREYDTKPKPLTCSSDTSITQACKKMSELNFGSIVIVDENNKVEGLVTERDIFRRVVAKELDPKTTTVGQIMSTQLRTANENDDLTDWLRIMSNERFRRLPIVNDKGQLVSVMSQGDFVSYTWPQLVNNAKNMARAAITKNYQVITVIGAILVYGLFSLILLARAM